MLGSVLERGASLQQCFFLVYIYIYIYDVILLLLMHTSYCFTQAQKEMTVLQDGVKPVVVVVTPYISNQYRYEAFSVKSNILFILCVVSLKPKCYQQSRVVNAKLSLFKQPSILRLKPRRRKKT